MKRYVISLSGVKGKGPWVGRRPGEADPVTSIKQAFVWRDLGGYAGAMDFFQLHLKGKWEDAKIVALRAPLKERRAAVVKACRDYVDNYGGGNDADRARWKVLVAALREVPE